MERPLAGGEGVRILFFVDVPLVPGPKADTPCARGGGRFGQEPELYRERGDGVGILEVELQVAYPETAQIRILDFALVVEGEACTELKVVRNA